MSKATSLEDFKQIDTFQSLRNTLSQPQYSDRLERPLAYWALPSDRRLPLAFLGRSLRQLFDTPFETLVSTPGIGRKKIESLLTLLNRATKQRSANNSTAQTASPAERDGAAGHASRGLEAFNPALVSEALWDQWRETVRRNSLSSLKLGLLATSLQELPTVIWHTALSTYLDHSLAELRQFKTHGEKRINAILHIFYSIHGVLAFSQRQSHLALRMTPQFVVPIETWIVQAIQTNKMPGAELLRQCVTVPLLEQVHLDCGSTVARLAEGRLGIQSAAQSVRNQAKKMGVTRARVYQLLEECGQAIQVRWPEGRVLLLALRQHFQVHGSPTESTDLLNSVVELFFPSDEDVRRQKAEGNRAGNES